MQDSPFAVEDVTFTAITCRAAADLVEAGTAAGLDTSVVAPIVDRMRAAIGALWDESDGWFRSYDLRADRPITTLTAGGLLALWARASSDEQTRRMLDRLDRWAKVVPYAVPSSDPTDITFEPQRYWRGPVWVLLNWMVADGLAAAGHTDRAEALRATTHDLVARAGFCEYFDPTTGDGIGGQGFSWTAALDARVAHGAGCRRSGSARRSGRGDASPLGRARSVRRSSPRRAVGSTVASPARRARPPSSAGGHLCIAVRAARSPSSSGRYYRDLVRVSQLDVSPPPPMTRPFVDAPWLLRAGCAPSRCSASARAAGAIGTIRQTPCSPVTANDLLLLRLRVTSNPVDALKRVPIRRRRTPCPYAWRRASSVGDPSSRDDGHVRHEPECLSNEAQRPAAPGVPAGLVALDDDRIGAGLDGGMQPGQILHLHDRREPGIATRCCVSRRIAERQGDDRRTSVDRGVEDVDPRRAPSRRSRRSLRTAGRSRCGWRRSARARRRASGRSCRWFPRRRRSTQRRRAATRPQPPIPAWMIGCSIPSRSVSSVVSILDLPPERNGHGMCPSRYPHLTQRQIRRPVCEPSGRHVDFEFSPEQQAFAERGRGVPRRARRPRRLRPHPREHGPDRRHAEAARVHEAARPARAGSA